MPTSLLPLEWCQSIPETSRELVSVVSSQQFLQPTEPLTSATSVCSWTRVWEGMWDYAPPAGFLLMPPIGSWDHTELQASEQWFWNVSCNQNHLEGFTKQKLQNPPPRVTHSIGLRWGLRICILHKFPSGMEQKGAVLKHLGESSSSSTHGLSSRKPVEWK